MQRRLTTALVFTLLASACTPMPRQGDTPLSPEEIRLRAIESKADDAQRRLNAVENRVDTATQDELRRLRSELEQLRFDLETAQRGSRSVTIDLERRVARIEAAQAQQQAVAAATVNGPTPPLANVPPSPASVSTSAPSGLPTVIAAPVSVLPNPAEAISAPLNTAEEEAAYQRAFDYLKGGKYDNAIVAFRAVIDKWPRGNYTDSAWYWLGESQYVRRQYAPALSSFNTVIERFGGSGKLADALFKAGLCHNELGRADQARSLWTRVAKDYPNSNAANLARQRLAQKR